MFLPVLQQCRLKIEGRREALSFNSHMLNGCHGPDVALDSGSTVPASF